MADILRGMKQSDTYFSSLVGTLVLSMTTLSNIVCIDKNSNSVRTIICDYKVLQRLSVFIDSAEELNLNFILEASNMFEIITNGIKQLDWLPILDAPELIGHFIQSFSSYLTIDEKNDRYKQIHEYFMLGLTHIMGLHTLDGEDAGFKFVQKNLNSAVLAEIVRYNLKEFQGDVNNFRPCMTILTHLTTTPKQPSLMILLENNLLTELNNLIKNLNYFDSDKVSAAKIIFVWHNLLL